MSALRRYIEHLIREQMRYREHGAYPYERYTMDPVQLWYSDQFFGAHSIHQPSQCYHLVYRKPDGTLGNHWIGCLNQIAGLVHACLIAESAGAEVVSFERLRIGGRAA